MTSSKTTWKKYSMKLIKHTPIQEQSGRHGQPDNYNNNNNNINFVSGSDQHDYRPESDGYPHVTDNLTVFLPVNLSSSKQYCDPGSEIIYRIRK